MEQLRVYGRLCADFILLIFSVLPEGSFHVDQISFKLTAVLLHQPPRFQGHKHASLHLAVIIVKNEQTEAHKDRYP